jgi:hypothetical protein
MSQIDTEIAAYEKMLVVLEAQHHGKWVVIRGGDLASVHQDFEAAAEDAVQHFGRGPYLIRQVGVPRDFQPAAFIYSSSHGAR